MTTNQPKGYKKIQLIMLKFKTIFFFALSLFTCMIPHAQEDAFFIKEIYNTALTRSKCYTNLHYLSTQIGGRLAGSPQAAAGVEYTYQLMQNMGMDTVWLQPCTVPHWVRGEKEIVKIVNSTKAGTLNLRATSLGNSDGTGPNGLSAEVIEVHSLEQVDSLGTKALQGKIVFYNRPMNPTHIRTFHAYGGAVDQRGSGPALAAKYGAVAAIVRSMTTNLDDVPHTGVTIFRERDRRIPALAISTNDAEMLSQLMQEEKVRLYIRNTSYMSTPKLSYNVIGEIKGSTHPDEIILVGGHLDSWDIGSGAHDDGAGCMHSIEVIHLLKMLNYQPKRTIRCVMFMNEENGLEGAREYARVSNVQNEFHMAAIESDAGGFSPRGFSFAGHEATFTKNMQTVSEWLPLLEPYGLYFTPGGSGADVSQLKSQKGLLAGLRVDSQRYFDFHHTADDTIDAVNKRELELGAAAMTALVYLLDKYGLE